MAASQSDVIAAIATAPGRGGIGIVRISGRDLADLAYRLTARHPKPRDAGFVRFRDGAGGVIDEGLLLYFPAPHSFTGEDVVELQGHGGPVVMRLLLERCVELGARLAEAGEFSRRAFLNGKLDLAQAEAVADLIEAGSAAAARSAMRSLSGEFSREISTLSNGLIELRMLVEATLDFPEEEIEFLKQARALERLAAIESTVCRLLERARQGALLRAGMQVVLVGQPNVGKSSVLNALAGDDRAIVTDIPGTTRDVVREEILLDGIPVHVLDTAGLRESEDPVERIGVERTWREIERADVILRIVDARFGLSSKDIEIDDNLPDRIPRLTVFNKLDLVEPSQVRDEQGVVWVSAKTGAGMECLRRTLLQLVGWESGHGEDVVLARERHLVALRGALQHIVQARMQSEALELFAEELRLAHEQLEQVTGEFTPDDLLGEIFSRFCIGK